MSPVSDKWGFDRGLPVDRYYIERYLDEHRFDISGRVLEIGDDTYTRRFGGSRVARSDVLHIDPSASNATIVGDITDLPHVESDSFDAIIITQTLHLIFDLESAVATLHRILRPGGSCLLTVPGISRIDRSGWEHTWYWSLTPVSARRLMATAFGDVDIEVESFGNVLTACAFLQGFAAHEIRASAMLHHDPCFPVVVAVRAEKAARV